ncbi:hypothetical protein DB29_01802 [Shouchella clausii]|nr:hypothetical protein DB29_01802 [Shouchella clausii]
MMQQPWENYMGLQKVRRSTQTPPPTLHPLSGKKIAQTGSP